MLRMVSSLNALPITCIPIGNPPENPHGIEILGMPAMFTGIVNVSLLYIETGSFAFSPMWKAVVGVVGVIKASNRLKICSNSSRSIPPLIFRF